MPKRQQHPIDSLLMHSAFELLWSVIVCLMVNQWVRVRVGLELGLGLIARACNSDSCKTFGDLRTLWFFKIVDYQDTAHHLHYSTVNQRQVTCQLWHYTDSLRLSVKYMQMEVVIITYYLLEWGASIYLHRIKFWVVLNIMQHKTVDFQCWSYG